MKRCARCNIQHVYTDERSCWKAMQEEIQWLTWHVMAFNPQIIESRLGRY